MSDLTGRMFGRYRLDALLGRGGMAEVFRATDTKLARTVAVKVILATHAAEEHFLERFLREARMVASLEHPNILPVYDFGEEGGVPFLVMPYLSGGSLRERLRAGPVPLAVASAWIAQLSEALDAAHAAGVLHRDVKPANVLLGKDDRLFLADFGIAKMLESDTGLTATGVVVGTPIYMAPEQAMGKRASPATDRYALAVVAFEILSGRPPFEGDTALSLMHQHVSTPPPALSARVPGLPAGLDTVLAQALAKDPDERPVSCRAFATGVAAYAAAGITPPHGLSGAPTGPTVYQSLDPKPATPVPATIPWTPSVPAPSPVRVSDARPSLTSAETVLTGPRRGAGRAGLVGAGAILVLAGAWWMASRRGAEQPAPGAAGTTALSAPAASAIAPVPPAPAPVTIIEVPPASTSGEPLGKKLVEEDKRIAQLEVRLRKAEAAAHDSRSLQAAPAPVPPPAPPAGVAPAGPETAEEPGGRGVPGPLAGRLIAARERLEPGRKPAHRLSGEDFRFALDEAKAVLEEHPRNPDAKYLIAYARGGLAYLARKDAEAGAILVQAFTEFRRAARRDARPLAALLLRADGTVGSPVPWELAIAYGDARGEAMGLIEQELSVHPRNVRALKARAQLRRMQSGSTDAPDDAQRPGIFRRRRPG